MRIQGKVKFFAENKGYGFITPSEGGKDHFVHISAVEKSGLVGLPEGATVEYELQEHKGKMSAANLKIMRGQ